MFEGLSSYCSLTVLNLKVRNIMSTSERSIQAAQAHGQGTTIITTFEGIEYCLDPAAAQVISFKPSRPSDGFFSSLNEDLRPCTVINYSKDQPNKKELNAIISKTALHDDVWTPAFLEGETNCSHEIAREDCLQYNTSQQSSFFNHLKLRNYGLRKMGSIFS